MDQSVTRTHTAMILAAKLAALAAFALKVGPEL